MINWSKYPFVRLLMPLVLGIWLSLYLQIVLPYEIILISIVAASSLTLILLVVSEFVNDYRFRWCFGMLLNVLLILIGVSLTNIRDADVDVQRDYWLARLTECPNVR